MQNKANPSLLTVPPEHLQTFVGGGDFHAVGSFFLSYLTSPYVDFKPQEKILDVGCGCGRIAFPLVNYIDGGEYHGFDISSECIDWCNDNIACRYPSFHFDQADIYNKRYNPKGNVTASEFVFPYADETFDVLILTSVLTHLEEPDMLHYLREIKRVLKVGGRSIITYFLFNESGNADPKRRDIRFPHDFGHYKLHDVNEPEHAIAFDEAFIRETYQKLGFTIAAIDNSLQDIVIATKG